jgi:hypothetical protein
MTFRATSYAVWEGVDVAAAAAVLARNAAPVGHYWIEGVGALPRVSSILDQLAKPGLEKWKQRQIRDLYLRAAERIGPEPHRLPFASRLRIEASKLEDADRRKPSPATLGTAFHAYAEYRSRQMMGLDAGERPATPPSIAPAIEAWEQWVIDVEFRPILIEHRAWCSDFDCGFAGTLDGVAEVEGCTTLIDYKRSKDIYSTYLLQLAAYDHLLTRSTGLVADRLAIIKLPQETPAPVVQRNIERDEAAEHYAAFQSLIQLWHWARRVVEQASDKRTAFRRDTIALGQASPYLQIGGASPYAALAF